jgi:hypothetical protein
VNDLSGMKVGYLTVIGRSSQRSKYGHRLYDCVCACGNSCIVTASKLSHKTQISCGCKQGTNHGFNQTSYTPEYRVWCNMKTRCYNTNSKDYARYGARGIIVCERWRTSFANFYTDMGPRPSEWHSLDRIDNDGNYEPSNCRWATVEQQTANRGGYFAVIGS